MNQDYNQRSSVYYLVLTGTLMSVTLVLKLIFYFIPIINGYGLEFYLAGYIFGMMLIPNRKWQWTFALITPWLLLVIPPTVVNFWDLLWEYILALYIFIPFIYFDLFVKHTNKKYFHKTALVLQLCLFACMIILTIALKLFIHTLAGIWWWIPGEWWGSFIFNLPIYATTLGITLPITLMLYPALIKFKYANEQI